MSKGFHKQCIQILSKCKVLIYIYIMHAQNWVLACNTNSQKVLRIVIIKVKRQGLKEICLFQ